MQGEKHDLELVRDNLEAELKAREGDLEKTQTELLRKLSCLLSHRPNWIELRQDLENATKEKANLTHENTQHTVQIESLEARIVDLEKENQDLSESLDERKDELVTLQNQVTEKNADYQILVAKVQELEDKIKSKDDLISQTQAASRHDQTMKYLEAEESLKRELFEAKEAVVGLTEQVKERIVELESEKKQHEALKAEIGQLKDQIQKMKGHHDQVQRDLQTATRTLEELEAKKTEDDKILEQLRKEKKEFDNVIQAANERTKTAEDKSMQLEMTNQKLESDLKAAAQEKDQIIQASKTQMHGHLSEIGKSILENDVMLGQLGESLQQVRNGVKQVYETVSNQLAELQH